MSVSPGDSRLSAGKKKPGDLKLAYLKITCPMPNVYLGGLMITDGRGLPVEFRYTEPIQPTRIQQVLYGQVLSSYIKREVILETLLKSVTAKFQALIVEDEELLEALHKNVPVFRLSETQSPMLEAQGCVEELGEEEILLQASAKGNPVHLWWHLADQTGNATPYSVLIEAGETMDVEEPLKRITKALEIICQEAGITSRGS